jgi:hypothetical protein
MDFPANGCITYSRTHHVPVDCEALTRGLIEKAERRKPTGYHMPKLLEEEIRGGRFNRKGSPRFNQGKIWDRFNRCWDFNRIGNP